MKGTFDVLRWRFAAMGVSALLIITGIVLFFAIGFNTGIDFGSGYSERIQIAPVGFTARYEGDGSAVLSVSDGVLVLKVLRVEPATRVGKVKDVRLVAHDHHIAVRAARVIVLPP